MMSLPAMSFGDKFCFSRKGGIGGGGWVHPKGANSKVGVVRVTYLIRMAELPLGAVLSLPHPTDRNWGTFKSYRE